MPNLIRFEWPKSENGYTMERVKWDEIEDDGIGMRVTERAEMHQYRKIKPKKGASQSTIDLVSLVRGMGSAIYDKDSDFFLVPKGERKVIHRPLEQHSALFMEFAELENSDKAVLSFANEFGLLHGWYPVEEHVWWQYQVEVMRSAVEKWKTFKREGDLKNFTDWINYDSRRAKCSITIGQSSYPNRPALYVEPNDLWSAMQLQFAQTISGDAQLQRCAICPTWFTFGTGTGRRKSAQYCSDRCRKAAFLQRKQRPNA